jgi:Protein of unknown function (DUF3110)
MVGLSNELNLSPMRVYVILFNARTENEGIHSVQADDRNLIMMFAEEDDAIRYAMMLEAQDLPNPTVEAMDAQEIEDFCADSDYECILVEEGMLVVPPDRNVEETNWQADGQHRSADDKDRSDRDKSADDIDYDQIRRKLEGLL